MISAFPADAVEPFVVCPDGLFSKMLKEKGIPVISCFGLTQFNNCAYSYYRGLRWMILLREFILFFPTVWAIFRARSAWGKFKVVHVNEMTLPVVAILSRIVFPEARIFVHARSVQRTVRNWRLHVLTYIFGKYADRIVAIDETVADSIPAVLGPTVVHNGLSLPDFSEKRPVIHERPFTVAMVGVLGRAKGCREFVLAAEICMGRGYPIHFDFVGGAGRVTRGLKNWVLVAAGLKEDLSNELKALVDERNLASRVRFLPFTSDLGAIYRNVECVCFPSYLDAPGRPIFEAGLFGVPSVACISFPRSDTFVDGVTGILVPPRDPAALADAIIKLYLDPDLRRGLGGGARSLAESLFNARNNAKAMVDLYRTALYK
jgi:glycosyltransferase involved in cell wall biosynthesis